MAEDFGVLGGVAGVASVCFMWTDKDAFSIDEVDSEGKHPPSTGVECGDRDSGL